MEFMAIRNCSADGDILLSAVWFIPAIKFLAFSTFSGGIVLGDNFPKVVVNVKDVIEVFCGRFNRYNIASTTFLVCSFLALRDLSSASSASIRRSVGIDLT